MANIGMDGQTTEDIVLRLVSLPADDFTLALNKIKDKKVLKEAAIKVYMRDRTDMLKQIHAHAASLGLTLDY